MPKIQRANFEVGMHIKFRENPCLDWAIGRVAHLGKNTIGLLMKSGKSFTLSYWYATTDVLKPLR